MTAAEFCAWLTAMKAAGLARSDADAARQLGRTADSVVMYKRNGTDRTVSLACAALLQQVPPYGTLATR